MMNLLCLKFKHIHLPKLLGCYKRKESNEPLCTDFVGDPNNVIKMAVEFTSKRFDLRPAYLTRRLHSLYNLPLTKEW